MSYNGPLPQVVNTGGTGGASHTAYAVLCGGTTTTAALQSIAAVGTSGQLLTSNGAGALPTFQTASGSSITITGDSGGALTAGSFTFTGGTTGLTFSGAGTTETVTGTLVVANGGTGRATLTTHGVLVGAGTSAITQLAAATNNQILVGNTSADPSFKAFSINIQTFTSTGTYTPTSGMVYCVIECVGGGGGGGGAAGVATTYSGGGGGGGGGYARKFASLATIGASQTVTIGAAGNAGSSGNNSGGNGGDSSVGTICIGKGGTGGAGQSSNIANGGAGGVAGTGDITFPGSAGPCSLYLLTSAGVGSTTPGGASIFGAGGVGVTAFNASTTGTAGSLYGGGGGGGCSFNASAAAGGAGAKGVVTITEYVIS